jgi:hypothetical protein
VRLDKRAAQGYEHLVVEDLGLAALGRGDKVLVKNGKDVLADLGELGLDLLTVLLDEGNLLLVALGLLLLLDGGDDSPGCTASTDDVLVGDGKEVSLLNRELLVGGSDVLHVLDHLCIGISLAHVVNDRSWTYPRSARPARRAWPGRQNPRNPSLMICDVKSGAKCC